MFFNTSLLLSCRKRGLMFYLPIASVLLAASMNKGEPLCFFPMIWLRQMNSRHAVQVFTDVSPEGKLQRLLFFFGLLHFAYILI